MRVVDAYCALKLSYFKNGSRQLIKELVDIQHNQNQINDEIASLKKISQKIRKEKCRLIQTPD